MARTPNATQILETAETWRDRWLLEEGSVFTQENLWTKTNVDALITHYVKNLVQGNRVR